MYHVYHAKRRNEGLVLQKVGSYQNWREVNRVAQPIRAADKAGDPVRVYDDAGNLRRPRMIA